MTQLYSPRAANAPSREGTCAILANTIELVLPTAHPNPQPKRQIDWFSHFAHLMTDCRLTNWRHLANTTELVLPSANWNL